VLVDGYAMGSLSMTSFTVGAETEGSRLPASAAAVADVPAASGAPLPGVPADETNL
jgi:hypothetical protein